MKRIICEKVARIIKGRNELEKKLEVKISIRGKEVTITGEPNDEYIAEEVINALEFGFPFSTAMLIKEEDAMFEILNIKNYTKRKDLERVRARLIGRKGRTFATLSELTKCHFELKDNQIGIIGDPEYMKNAQDSIIFIMQGSKQANVYSFLEKHRPKPILDLGLKNMKKPKPKKKNR